MLREDSEARNRVEVHGVRIPTLVYGTAWKEDRTAALTRAALDAGFRGIDTANQRKHYHEAGVGEAIRGALQAGVVAREDLFVQTKFTYVRGQDARLPYDPRAPVAEQVAQSFASSLEHLGLERVDAYLLQWPWGFSGLSKEDWEAWGAMEALQGAGMARLIGISNASLAQLAELHAGASVQPSVVQNRTLTRPQADLGVRAFCRERGIAYEGFSLLTADPSLLAHPAVRGAAQRAGRTAAEVILRFWVDEGIVVLTGATSPEHVAQDLSIRDFRLMPEEAAALRRIIVA